MVLDLESAVSHYSADDRAFFTASSIADLAGKYGGDAGLLSTGWVLGGFLSDLTV